MAAAKISSYNEMSSHFHRFEGVFFLSLCVAILKFGFWIWVLSILKLLASEKTNSEKKTFQFQNYEQKVIAFFCRWAFNWIKICIKRSLAIWKHQSSSIEKKITIYGWLDDVKAQFKPKGNVIFNNNSSSGNNQHKYNDVE